MSMRATFINQMHGNGIFLWPTETDIQFFIANRRHGVGSMSWQKDSAMTADWKTTLCKESGLINGLTDVILKVTLRGQRTGLGVFKASDGIGAPL